MSHGSLQTSSLDFHYQVSFSRIYYSTLKTFQSSNLPYRASSQKRKYIEGRAVIADKTVKNTVLRCSLVHVLQKERKRIGEMERV